MGAGPSGICPLNETHGVPELEGGRGFGYGDEYMNDAMRKVRSYIRAVQEGLNPHIVDAYRELQYIRAREIPRWRKKWQEKGLTTELDEDIKGKIRKNDIRTAHEYQNNIAKKLAENPNARARTTRKFLEK